MRLPGRAAFVDFLLLMLLPVSLGLAQQSPSALRPDSAPVTAACVVPRLKDFLYVPTLGGRRDTGFP